MSIKQGVLTAAVAATVGGLLTLGMPANAEAADGVDTSDWECRFCEFPTGWLGTVRGGIGYVSDDSAKFGEYSDLDDEGAYLDLSGAATYYGEEARRWDLLFRDLGLDTRYVSLDGGQQGVYRLGLTYDEILRHVSDSGRTPFRGVGSESLRLPAGWTRASSTRGMSDLPASLRGVALGSRRRRADIDLRVRQSDNWSYTFEAEHEKRSGRKLTGGAFINSTSQLPENIDDKTSGLTVGARYATDLWQLGMSYRGSFYRNEDDRLVWDNPYAMPGPDRGRSSVAPDNQAHQLTLSGSYRFSHRAFYVGDLSIGHMRQDEDFLPPTSNPGIAPPALPRSSAEAEVNTLTANGRFTYRTPLPRLSLLLDYRINRRDNDTARDVFTQVVTDRFVGDERINEPLSYDRYQAGLQATYRLRRRGRFSGGIDYERFARDYGDDATTDEYALWGEYRRRLNGRAEVRMKVTRAERSGDGQDPASASPSAQNPRMTWFDVADRSRTALKVSLHHSLSARSSLAFTSRVIDEDFNDTTIGRTDMKRVNLGLDFTTRPRENTTVYSYVSHEYYETAQQNSRVSGLPDWRRDTEDTYLTAGLGGQISEVKGKLDLALDLVYSDSTGETGVDESERSFPDLRTRRFLARLRGDYPLRDNLTLGMHLAYESYRSDAWMLDGVDPGTVAGLLALGEDSPSYDVLTSVLSMEYTF